jgi:integrase
LSVLKFILKDAVEHGYLTENTVAKVKPLRCERRDDSLHFLRPDQIVLLIGAAEEPYRTIYLVAVNTGLRRGELLGLRWQDVDLSRQLLHVRRSLGRIRDEEHYVVREMAVKTRQSRRTIDLSPTVVAALTARRTGGDTHADYIFLSRASGPIDPSNLNRVFRRHLALAGLPHIRFHDLRHTHASLLIAAGVHPKAIQARMGHASITTTLNTYGHLMPTAFQGIGEKLDALIHCLPQDHDNAIGQ